MPSPINEVKEDIRRIESTVELNWFHDKEILITGASGIIGSYITELMLSIDKKNIQPRRVIAVSKSGISPFRHTESNSLTLLKGDLTSNSFLESIPSVDAIFHAAGYGQPSLFLQNKLATLDLNTKCTSSLLRKVRKGGKFLFYSSSEVYSGSSILPHVERAMGTTGPQHPRSAYIEGKRCGEALVNAAREELNIKANSARLSLAYGPGTKLGDTRVLNSFIHRAITENEITLLDNGNAIRTYCYISDAVALSLAIMIEGTEPTYNLGGISRVSINELAHEICSQTKAKITLPAAESGLAGAPKEVWLDLTKTLGLFENYIFIDIVEGLRKTINWQKQNLYRL